jgi:hypothetical protein
MAQRDALSPVNQNEVRSSEFLRSSSLDPQSEQAARPEMERTHDGLKVGFIRPALTTQHGWLTRMPTEVPIS